MKIVIFAEGPSVKLISDAFEGKSEFELVGTASSQDKLIQIMNSHKQIVAICDITNNTNFMVKMESIAQQKKMKLVVMVKDVNQGFDALSKGAIEMVVLPKGQDKDSISLKSFNAILQTKIRKIYKEYDVDERPLKKNLTFNKSVHKVVGIGSSTGGTEVMLEILKQLPADGPPVLVVQHMPAVFTKLYAKRLDGECKMTVWEAQDGDEVRPGLVLIAPGDRQMRLEQRGGKFIVTCRKEEKVGGHMPSVDVLFDSIVQEVGKNSIAVMLTGMGRDGADAMLRMRNKGAYTIGQDQKTCMVYGMPKAAFEIGAVEIQAPPKDMPRLIMNRA